MSNQSEVEMIARNEIKFRGQRPWDAARTNPRDYIINTYRQYNLNDVEVDWVIELIRDAKITFDA